MIKDLYPKCIKNSQNSTISKQTTQLKIDKIFEQTFYQEPLSHRGSDRKVSAYNERNPGSILGPGRSSGEGNGNPLQYSCLENPTDGGVW